MLKRRGAPGPHTKLYAQYTRTVSPFLASTLTSMSRNAPMSSSMSSGLKLLKSTDMPCSDTSATRKQPNTAAVMAAAAVRSVPPAQIRACALLRSDDTSCIVSA